MPRSTSAKVFTMAAVSVLLLTGCQDQPTEPSADALLVDQTALQVDGQAMAAHGAALAAVRKATAQYHRIERATMAGFVELTPCLESPEGGQGFHYGNPALIDGNVDATQPEVLLYEPQAGGHMRLVAVEYIVPLNLPEPAALFGHEFHANEDAGLWALHLWNWRQNPSGAFADWNPKVSCQHAS